MNRWASFFGGGGGGSRVPGLPPVGPLKASESKKPSAGRKTRRIVGGLLSPPGLPTQLGGSPDTDPLRLIKCVAVLA